MRAPRSLYVALSVFALDNLGISVVLPIFSKLILASDFGLFPPDVALSHKFLLLGLLIGAFPAAMIFGALAVGYFSDAFGRKKAFLTTLGGELIATFITGWALMERNYSLLVVGRALSGFFAGNMTVALATVADLSPPGRGRTGYLGKIGLVSGLSFIVGVAVGGTLSDPRVFNQFSPALVFWIVGGLTILNFCFIAFYFKETHVVKVTLLPSGLKEIIWHYAAYFFAVLGWFAIVQFLTPDLYVRFHSSKLMMTWILLATGFIFAITTGTLGKQLCVLCAIKPLVLSSLFLTTLFLIFAGSVVSFSLFLTSYFLSVVGISIVWVAVLSRISSEAGKGAQGKTMSANQAILGVSMAIAPIAGGAIAQHFSLAYIYYFAAGSTGIAFLLYLIFIKRK